MPDAVTNRSPTPRLITTVADSAGGVARTNALESATVLQTATLCSVAIGVTLRFWQYLSAPSLYWGELALARNIDARSIGQLLSERTAFGQGASPGYLLVQNLVVDTFGSSELSHRFFPFLASLLALVMFVRLTGPYLSGAARLLAITCFSLGFPFLFVTSPFKALASVDTAATLALFLVAHDLLKSDPSLRRSLLAGLAGLGLVWFAEATIIMASGFAVALITLALAQRNFARLRQLMPVVLLWAAAGAAAVILDRETTDAATRTILRDLYAGAEPPAFPDVTGQARWLYDRLSESLGPVLFHFRFTTLILAGMVLGLVALATRRQRDELLLVVPVAATLAAATAGWYIFQGFYLAVVFPYLFVLLALGADFLRTRVERLVAISAAKFRANRAVAMNVARTLGAATMLAWLAIPVVAVAEYPPPYHVADMKSVLSYVRDRKQSGDVVYGLVTAAHALNYYGPQFGFKEGDFIVGACNLGEPRKTLAELDQFRGQSRVWVLFTHDLARFDVRGETLNYLNRVGTLRDSIVIAPPRIPTFVPGASAYLFDLSDTTKLAAAAAESVPLVKTQAPTVNSGCGKGMLSADQP